METHFGENRISYVNVNPFMHNVVKWPNILKKFCTVHTARFLKYVWPFYNMQKKAKLHQLIKRNHLLRLWAYIGVHLS